MSRTPRVIVLTAVFFALLALTTAIIGGRTQTNPAHVLLIAATGFCLLFQIVPMIFLSNSWDGETQQMSLSTGWGAWSGLCGFFLLAPRDGLAGLLSFVGGGALLGLAGYLRMRWAMIRFKV